MPFSFTESLQQHRFVVVGADLDAGRVRLRSAADACTDLTCHETTVVVAEDGPSPLSTLNPGDIVTVRATGGRATEIVVVRRVWDELSSPEF